jgi:hypothetical protein
MQRTASREATIDTIIVLALGAWLIAWPELLGHAAADPIWRTTAGGTLVTGLALARLARRADGAVIDCMLMVAGGALGLSALLLDASFTATWMAGTAGPVIAVLALCSLLAGIDERTWRSSA